MNTANSTNELLENNKARSLFSSVGPNSSQSKNKYNKAISTKNVPGKL